MSNKKFPFKTEEVPVIGEFVMNSAEKDISDFNGYSSVFTSDYFAKIKANIEVCRELVKSSAVSKELKAVTRQLYGESKKLRTKLNVLEGYLKLGADKLDIALKDIGLKSVRSDITRNNIEGTLSNTKASLIAVKRNLPALVDLGLKQTLIDEIETQLREINALNVKQNTLISKRSRLTSENIDKINNLWNSLKLILTVARAMYRGVDEVKLKDYTIAQLKKRVNAES
jgi:hypothetical protein